MIIVHTHSLDLGEGRAYSANQMDIGVETIGRILYTLHDMDWSQVPNVKRLIEENGETCTEIPLVLNIRLDDEVGHLVFRILCNGREAGKAKLDLDH